VLSRDCVVESLFSLPRRADNLSTGEDHNVPTDSAEDPNILSTRESPKPKVEIREKRFECTSTEKAAQRSRNQNVLRALPPIRQAQGWHAGEALPTP